jgi:hypothetical protein
LTNLPDQIAGTLRHFPAPPLVPESGVKTSISEFERVQPVKLCEYVSGQVSEQRRLAEPQYGTILRASKFAGEQEQLVAQLGESQVLP